MSLFPFCYNIFLFLLIQVCTGAKSEQQSKLASRKVNIFVLSYAPYTVTFMKNMVFDLKTQFIDNDTRHNKTILKSKCFTFNYSIDEYTVHASRVLYSILATNDIENQLCITKSFY